MTCHINCCVRSNHDAKLNLTIKNKNLVAFFLAHFLSSVSMTGLHDSCNVYQHQQITSGSSGQRFDFTTCGHPFNTFTPPNTAYVKRIDYIFYRLISNETRVRSNLNNFLKHHPCVIDRIECSTKCASSGLSFSDHQPVAIKLSIRHVSDGTVENEDTRSNAMPITNKFEEISQSSTSLSESESNSPKSMSRSDSPGHCDVLHVEMGSGDLNGALKNRKTSESVSSSTFHMSRNACNNEIQETCLGNRTNS